MDSASLPWPAATQDMKNNALDALLKLKPHDLRTHDQPRSSAEILQEILNELRLANELRLRQLPEKEAGHLRQQWRGRVS
jgi:hypothetical protein